MNAVAKPKRWSVRKAAHLAEVAELMLQRNAAQNEAYNLRVDAHFLRGRITTLSRHRRVLAWSAAAGLVGTVLGVFW